MIDQDLRKENDHLRKIALVYEKELIENRSMMNDLEKQNAKNKIEMLKKSNEIENLQAEREESERNIIKMMSQLDNLHAKAKIANQNNENVHCLLKGNAEYDSFPLNSFKNHLQCCKI
jgi:hypothetical protein